MKYVTILLTLCLATQLSYGQAENGVKVGLSNFLWGTIAYERAIADNFSLELEYGRLLGAGTFNTALRDFVVTDDNGNEQSLNDIKLNDRTLNVDDFKFSGFHYTLKGRFYPGDEAIQGFYVGPYLTFSSHGYRNATASDNLGFDYTGKFLLNTFNVGGMLGWNWVLGGDDSGFLIDLTLVGVSLGIMRLKTGYTTTDPNVNFAEQVAEIEEWFQTDEARINGNLNIKANDDGVDISTGGISPLGRIQLAIGYAF